MLRRSIEVVSADMGAEPGNGTPGSGKPKKPSRKTRSKLNG
jgi:hypothetical protein